MLFLQTDSPQLTTAPVEMDTTETKQVCMQLAAIAKLSLLQVSDDQEEIEVT